MKLLIDPLRQAASRPRLVILTWAGMLLWLAAFWWWLGVPVATSAQIAVQAAAAVALVLLPLFGLRLLYRASGGARFRPRWASLLALVVFAAAGLWAPFELVWFVPKFASFSAQALSAGIRFLAAGALVSFALVWLIHVVVLDGKALPAEEQTAHPAG